MLRTLFILAFSFGGAVTVKADLFLDLRFTDNTTARTVVSGETVSVDLILRDPSDDNGLSLEGLQSGGGLIFQTGGLASVATAGVTAGPEFDPGVVQFVAPGGGVIDSAFVFAPFTPVPPFAIPAGLGLTSITLATFQMTVTGNVGDTATLSADVLDPTHVLAGNVTFDTFTDLDALLTDLGATPGNFGSVSLSVTAVPEPETLLFFAVVVLGGMMLWRNRRQAALSRPSIDTASQCS